MRSFDPHQTPQELAPARVNGKAIFTLGTLAWIAALATLGVVHLTGNDVAGRYAAICVVGIGFGVIGFFWADRVRRHENEELPR